MLFNSIDFAIFLPLVFVLYWFVLGKSLRAQNVLIVIASYVFYGWWDWRFLSLILFSTVVDYLIGRGLSVITQPKKRKLLLMTSLLVNLGILGYFKYFNFFIDNFHSAFRFFGADMNLTSLNIVLPVGISFYTFQTLSYSIDVYRGKFKPTRDFMAFAAFVSFFPQLVAGPIERATRLLPQFFEPRKFNYDQAQDGSRQILLGLFKKTVIADNCAEYVNLIFNNHQQYGASTLILGAVLFSFQIYCDFSGYSDIAIGTARLFGFRLMQNFAFPYFSRDIAEFWRRWHISLSTWFRDYVYIPLGGSRGTMGKKVRNTFAVFALSGLWHGANWTFLIWGILHALFFLPLLLAGNNRNNLDVVGGSSLLPTPVELSRIMSTFGLVTIGWVFFRAENLSHAVSYISGFFDASILAVPGILSVKMMMLFAFLLGLLGLEWLNRNGKHALDFQRYRGRAFRYMLYFSMSLSILWFRGNTQDFIYFQF